jgi:hypothetical protein
MFITKYTMNADGIMCGAIGVWFYGYYLDYLLFNLLSSCVLASFLVADDLRMRIVL